MNSSRRNDFVPLFDRKLAVDTFGSSCITPAWNDSAEIPLRLTGGGRMYGRLFGLVEWVINLERTACNGIAS